MRVKPAMHINADGLPQQLIVPLPNRQFMPPEGMEVDMNDFHFARLMRDGDIVEVTETEAPPAEPAPESDTAS